MSKRRFAIYVQRAADIEGQGYLAADQESLTPWSNEAQLFGSLAEARAEMKRRGFEDSTKAPFGKVVPGMAYACEVSP